MPPRSARRLCVLTTSLLLTVGLLAPTAASATAPSGSAAVLGARGSGFADEPQLRASATSAIEVRDLSAACPKGRVPNAGFRDVPSNYPFAKAIDCLVWYGVTQGKTTTTYAPNDSVTRQQMAVFIYRTLEYLQITDFVEPPSRSQFRDVPATGEAGEAINVLASDELADLLGVQIVAGKTATTFDPRGRVTRAQMGSFIARTLRGVAHFNGARIDRGACTFRDDAVIPTAHRDNVKLLCELGIVVGRADGSYGPGLDVNRGQMAAFLMRMMDLFVDDAVGITIPPDAYAEVFVDRGTGVSACSNSGRDGTRGNPYCTIQAAISRARKIEGFAVDVVVRDRAQPYAESVVLSSGSAFEVNLLPMRDAYVSVLGSIRIDGARARDANLVWGFDVVSPSAPAFSIGTPGTAVLVDTSAEAPTAVSVDQSGRTGVVWSTISGDAVGIDLVRTVLTTDGWGTGIFENEFTASTDAYVRAPASGASATVVDANLAEWREFNAFATGTKIGSSGSRKAIVPA